MGVRIHERSPATEIAPGKVSTAAGGVICERVVVATNAYQHAFPQFADRVVPIWSYAMVTEPLSDEQLGRVAWPGREGFEDKRNFITIGRFTADNRVIWGGRLAPYYRGNDMDVRHMRNEHVFDELRGAWAEFFPMWSDVRFDYAYGGCVGITGTFLPYVGSLGGGVLYGYGYNGHGVAPSHTVGRTLADLAPDTRSEHTELVFVDQKESKLPGEPLRYLGTRLTTALLERQDRKMDRGGGVGEMDPLILRVVNSSPSLQVSPRRARSSPIQTALTAVATIRSRGTSGWSCHQIASPASPARRTSADISSSSGLERAGDVLSPRLSGENCSERRARLLLDLAVDRGGLDVAGRLEEEHPRRVGVLLDVALPTRREPVGCARPRGRRRRGWCATSRAAPRACARADACGARSSRRSGRRRPGE